MSNKDCHTATQSLRLSYAVGRRAGAVKIYTFDTIKMLLLNIKIQYVVRQTTMYQV